MTAILVNLAVAVLLTSSLWLGFAPRRRELDPEPPLSCMACNAGFDDLDGYLNHRCARRQHPSRGGQA